MLIFFGGRFSRRAWRRGAAAPEKFIIMVSPYPAFWLTKDRVDPFIVKESLPSECCLYVSKLQKSRKGP